MSKSISLTQSQWTSLYNQLKKDLPLTTLMIRSRMRDTLGFTTREHAKWNRNHTGKEYTVELDFYNESKKTMFLLKYSDFVQKRTESVL